MAVVFIEYNEARSVAETLSGLLGTRGRAAGWCARSEEDTCSMLRALSRSRGRDVPASASRCSIPRQCPYYDCNRPPWCIWSDEEKRWLRDLAARHVPHGTCLKGSGPMLGLSFDAEQGFAILPFA